MSFDVAAIKAAATADPLPFLHRLYGAENVRADGTNCWRVGRKGGKKFDTAKGALLCCAFNGDAECGDVFSVWQAREGVTFPEAVREIAGLYGIGPGGATLPRERNPVAGRIDREARLGTRPAMLPLLDRRMQSWWRDAVERLDGSVELQQRIAVWRGWPVLCVKRLARAWLLGFADFDFWPGIIRPQPCAVFRELWPDVAREARSGLDFTHLKPVRLRVRFECAAAAGKDGRRLDWLTVPTRKHLGDAGNDAGGSAPLVIARDGRDPEQPGRGERCESVIICAGEWDALTVLLATPWLDDNGTLALPRGLAIVGIRGEGRGGTDAYLRHYAHWKPRSVIVLADADATGLSWFESSDGRPCFAEQLTRRGAKVSGQVPERGKDVGDLYRAGALGWPDVETRLADAGWKPPRLKTNAPAAT